MPPPLPQRGAHLRCRRVPPRCAPGPAGFPSPGARRARRIRNGRAAPPPLPPMARRRDDSKRPISARRRRGAKPSPKGGFCLLRGSGAAGRVKRAVRPASAWFAAGLAGKTGGRAGGRAVLPLSSVGATAPPPARCRGRRGVPGRQQSGVTRPGSSRGTSGDRKAPRAAPALRPTGARVSTAAPRSASKKKISKNHL